VTWTDPDDIVARWVGGSKPTMPDDHMLLSVLIEDAERAIIAADPTIPTRIWVDGNPLPDNPLPVETFKQVVARMVTRHLRNPDGIRQMSEGEGPFTRARTYAGDMPGELELTAGDRALLGLTAGGQTAFSITPGTQQTAWLGSSSGW
jgi:hypothetical protein